MRTRVQRMQGRLLFALHTQIALGVVEPGFVVFNDQL
jgi:hypothetical protein